MKRNSLNCLILLLVSFATTIATGQVIKRDSRKSVEREDPYGFYDEESISKTDILKGLELLGLRIYKFDVPGSLEENQVTILAREFKGGKEVNVDTIAHFSNQYYYWDTGMPDPYIDFIREISIFSNTKNNKSELQFDLVSSVRKYEFELENNSEDQFYQWRKYQKAFLKENKEMPLLIFASSWIFPGDTSHRFCGVVELNEEDPMTKELLDYSQHYVKFSLKVEK